MGFLSTAFKKIVAGAVSAIFSPNQFLSGHRSGKI